MNKLTKGAIASAAGIILLMGGAGTLASWNAAGTAGATQAISAGQLAIAPSGTTGVWKDGTATVTSSTKVVPGDVLTFTQNYTVTSSGDNLKFTMALTQGAITAATTAGPDVALAGIFNNASNNATSVTLGTTPNISLVSGNTYKVNSAGTTTITAVLTITFPTGTAGDNTTQLGNVNLAAGAITLTQV